MRENLRQSMDLDKVTLDKTGDDEYAQQLGSDLAFKVLRSQFFSKRKWFVDKSKLKKSHILYP